jgi:uncharacterized SAM-binding protein YcdF (DUF218 family)
LPEKALPETTIREGFRSDVETLWNYHDLRHELRQCDAGIGLGGRDLGVAVVAVDLFRRGLFPLVVFTGGNSPTTVRRFPRGEAVHYREYAIANGVPAESILLEPRATNTLENIAFAREVLIAHRIRPHSVLIMSRPYQQRRAYATCKKLWPEVAVVCAARRLSLDDYVESIGDAKRVVDMIVGDTQRIELYAERGFAIPQEVPARVRAAYDRLVEAGYTGRLV